MLPALLICTTLTLCVAGPLHKYPYVFLLDVGNEELEKINTEQLRISIPGGSLAMKYPVLGEGDTISHVRVSGIDFGTDLKVNIVEGGPGYKYVVLVFMGNPGVTYDAVVTLQTLPSGMDINEVDKSEVVNTKMKINSNSYDEENDEGSNNKAMTMKQYIDNSNSEVMQSSSTFYNYAKGGINTANDEESEDTSAEEQDDDDNDDEDNVSSKGEDEDSASSNEDNDSFNEESESFNGESESSDENNEASNEENSDEVNQSAKNNEVFIQNSDLISPRAEQYTYNIEDSSSADDKPADILDDNLYEKYLDLKPHFPDGFKVYPQSYIYNKQYQVNSDYDKEDPVELEQMFNDEEVHSDSTYKDGSNSIDSDYAAVEY